MYPVPEEGQIYTTTPTFSWEAQSDVSEYKIQIFSFGAWRYAWGSPWAPGLSVEVLPVGILEVRIDALDPVRGSLHALVVSVVVNVEFFGGKQFFKNVCIVFKNILDEPVCLVEET